jgi:phosphoheptose isomerase
VQQTGDKVGKNMEKMTETGAIIDVNKVAIFLDDYRMRLSKAISLTDAGELGRAINTVVDTAATDHRIFSVGNGGSAAIADHLVCDWTKLTRSDGKPPILTSSLTANMPIYSAFANDFRFEDVFAEQIKIYGKKGDLLVAISSSGNSENIYQAALAAKNVGMTVIGMTGFSGGCLRHTADISLHVPCDNYGVVEDAHQALMHIIAQYLIAWQDR